MYFPRRDGGAGDCGSGESERTEECNADRCPTWTEWSECSACSRSCGPGGRTSRTRRCSVNYRSLVELLGTEEDFGGSDVTRRVQLGIWRELFMVAFGAW